MSSVWGNNIKISIYGESHGNAVGVVLDGIPAGIKIDTVKIEEMMARRAPGKDAYSTKRKEPDKVEINSGIYQNYTTGTPISGVIFNSDTRSQDYKDIPLRPSHADYTGIKRYSGYNDMRGGGHFSGRLTAPLVFAGAVAKQVLATQDITVGAYIKSIYTIDDESPDSLNVSKESIENVISKRFPVFSDRQGELMRFEIEKARLDQDSVGGIVRCLALNFPVGIGSPMFGGLENKLASIIFGIPAVRGVEFGLGFSSSVMKGSEHNDAFRISDSGDVYTDTNNHGGIIGGISSGMPIDLSVSFKPTASISKEQKSVDYTTKTNSNIIIAGRHDPCIVPRAVPVVESAVSLALLDSLLEGGNPNVSWNISPKNR